MWIINNQANFDILKPRKETNKTFKSQTKKKPYNLHFNISPWHLLYSAQMQI